MDLKDYFLDSYHYVFKINDYNVERVKMNSSIVGKSSQLVSSILLKSLSMWLKKIKCFYF